MTFYSAFKSEFEKQFSQYGFKKVKSKQPYWGRMVGDEILQVITYKNEWSMRPEKAFSVWGGIATVYRKKIDLDKTPKENDAWLVDNSRLYINRMINCNEPIDKEYFKKIQAFRFNADDESMIGAIQEAIRITKENILLHFNSVKNISDAFSFIQTFEGSYHSVDGFENLDEIHTFDFSEGLLNFMLFDGDSFKSMINKKTEESLNSVYEKVKSGKLPMTEEEFEKIRRDCYQQIEKNIRVFESVMNIGNEKIRAIANEKKIQNTTILKKYGLIRGITL